MFEFSLLCRFRGGQNPRYDCVLVILELNIIQLYNLRFRYLKLFFCVLNNMFQNKYKCERVLL